MMRQHLPKVSESWKDWHLHGVLAGTLLTGIGLWLWTAPGFARYLASDYWQLVGFLLVYPAFEEWLFRGELQGRLLRRGVFRRRHLGITRANALTTAVFGLLHLIHQSHPLALSVAIPSLILGHFRERYGNLYLPVGLHALFNATYLVAGLVQA